MLLHAAAENGGKCLPNKQLGSHKNFLPYQGCSQKKRMTEAIGP